MRTGKLFIAGYSIITTASVLCLVGFYRFSIQEKVVSYERHRDLIEAIEAVRQHPYTTEYQCLDFSKALTTKLGEAGIESRVEIVAQPGRTDQYHAVIALQIDPQNGEVVDYDPVDNCKVKDGTLLCRNGSIEQQNLYVANRNK